MKNTRRAFIQSTIKTGIIAAVSVPAILGSLDAAASGRQNKNNFNPEDAFKFTQVKLPYGYADLEPHIDALTTEIHYTKHHAAYIKNVNDAIIVEKLQFASEKDFFNQASKLSAKARNNGGGAWNHNFFWESLKPGPIGAPTGKLLDAIQESFGSIDKFKDEFSQAALARFGSGWVWLVNSNGTLKISSTSNQDNPLFDNAVLKGTPILALDVWEHAYYLKYQNKRNEYVTGWWNIVNWDEAAKRLNNI
jgi:Fe-Mn family superoxide dismutase